MAGPAAAKPPPSLGRRAASLSSAASSGAEAAAGGAVRGVIFDIDGTLADSWNLGFQATLTVLTEYHNENNPEEEALTADAYPLTAEDYHYGCRFTTPERLARHVGLNPDDPSFESVGEDLGGKFDEYYVRLVDRQTAGFYDGIGDLLVRLHSGETPRADGADGGSAGASAVQIGALTNACVEYAHAVLKAQEDGSIHQRFSSVHGANSVPRPKPFGDGILKCCGEMDLVPDQVIYVGDAPTDARAAVDAGCRAAIGVLWGSNDEETLKKEEGFEVLCGSVEELGRAIEAYL